MTDILSLPGKAPIYIILDALNECPNFPRNQSAREEVLKLIEGVNSEIPNLHLCVASRPEMDDQMALDPFTSFQLSLHDENWHKEDIIAYIESAVRSDPFLSQSCPSFESRFLARSYDNASFLHDQHIICVAPSSLVPRLPPPTRRPLV